MTLPLVICIRENHTDIAEMLLDAGADPNVLSGHESPLDTALLAGNVDAVRLLVARGADTKAVQPSSLFSGPPQAVRELRRVYRAEAGTLYRATHARLGADSPASLLRGFPGIAAFIVDRANPVPADKPVELP
jgi:ankyrin repeat protein